MRDVLELLAKQIHDDRLRMVELLGDEPRLTKKSGLRVFEGGWVRGCVKSDASLFNQLLVATSAGHCRSSCVLG